MERPRRHKPAEYQLGLDFGQKPLDAQQSEMWRFTFEVKEDVSVRSSEIAGAYLLNHVFTPFEAFEQEEVWVLSLNNKNKITHQSMVYRGTINTVNIRIGELFRPALRLNAAGIIMSHLHPSGDPDPSQHDIAVTQMAYEAGKLLEVSLIDHIIVGRNQFLSLKSLGVGFNDPLLRPTQW
jgi:DNA repair protein RadC